MRAKVMSIAAAAGCALGSNQALAQPKKLYIWSGSTLVSPSSDVIDAGLGGGAEPFTWNLYLTSSRVLVGTGDNRWGQHGYVPSGGYLSPCDTEPESCYLPQLVNGVIPGLRRLSVGWDHNLGLSDASTYSGTRGLVGWGRNDKGQCVAPMWDSSGNPVAPWNIDVNAKVSDISAGEFVNIVLFDNGQIAAWGDTTYGVHPPSNGTPGSGRTDPYMPPANWRFKKVAAGGHFVMALILDAPNSGLPYDSDTQRTGEGWIISWGTWSYNTLSGDVPTGPGFRGYATGFTSPYNGFPSENLPAAVYTPPYDDIFAGHIVCGGVIKAQSAYHKSQGIEVAPGTTHVWGNNSYNVIADHPTHLTFDHAVGGYSSWVQGVALLDYTNPQSPVGNFEINGWGGPSQSNAPPTGHPSGIVVGKLQLLPNANRLNTQAALCFDPNCDGSTGTPALTANDFQCFSNAYAAATAPGVTWYQQVTSYANCDGSTGNPAITANDFICFTNKYVLGPCP